MEPKDLPADLVECIKARRYFDYQHRMIEGIYDDVPPPTDRTIRSTIAFAAWEEWAEDYKRRRSKGRQGKTFGGEVEEDQNVMGFEFSREWDYWEGVVWVDPITRAIVKDVVPD